MQSTTPLRRSKVSTWPKPAASSRSAREQRSCWRTQGRNDHSHNSIEGFVRDSQAAIGELDVCGRYPTTVEVDNEVLSTSSEGAAGPGGTTVAETDGEVDTTEPDLQGEVLAEEGGVPTFDSAISGDDDSGGAAESDASEETDVSGEIGGDISVPPPVSGFQ